LWERPPRPGKLFLGQKSKGKVVIRSPLRGTYPKKKIPSYRLLSEGLKDLASPGHPHELLGDCLLPSSKEVF